MENDGEIDEAFEPIKVIEAWGWGDGYCCGNAINCILRAPHKGSERLDLERAIWHLRRIAGRREAVSRRQLGVCGAMRIAQAWKLPGRLQMALEHIEKGACLKAAQELEKHLAEAEGG